MEDFIQTFLKPIGIGLFTTAAFATIGAVHAGNLVSDGTFSNESTAQYGGYAYYPSGTTDWPIATNGTDGSGGFVVANQSSIWGFIPDPNNDPHDGILQEANNGSPVYFGQDVDLTSGDTYALNFVASNRPFYGASYGDYGINVLTTVGSGAATKTVLDAVTPANDNWTPEGSLFTYNGPSGETPLIFSINGGAGVVPSAVYNAVAFNDVSLVPAPETSSVALSAIALGAIAIVMIRKKQLNT